MDLTGRHFGQEGRASLLISAGDDGCFFPFEGNAYPLTPIERPMHDGGAIADIYRNLGIEAADQIVSRALAELAQLMQTIFSAHHDERWDELPRQFRKLNITALGLGLVTMAQVASDARICLQRGDGTAYGAIWARLLRLTECAFVGSGNAFEHSY